MAFDNGRPGRWEQATPAPTAPLTFDALAAEVEAGSIQMVELVIVDLQGRLQGKRLSAKQFVEQGAEGMSEVQSYLLATDVEMNTVDGYSVASWETGYGNFFMKPDLSTLRRLPWRPSSVSVLCDVLTRQGEPITVSPRQILRGQLERLGERGWTAHTGTEMEFQIFGETFEEAWNSGYRDMRPVSAYSADYAMLDTRGVNSLLTELYDQLSLASVDVESVVSEAGPGQQEIVLRYGDALRIADNHAFAKFAIKELVAARGHSATFIPKFDQHAGNSCHVHFSLCDRDGGSAFAGNSSDEFSPVLQSFLAGQLAYLPELTLLLAPNINSYKRFVEGSWAPTAVSWGFDNRSCALRVLGSGKSLRFEHRLPGADVNPHIATAAIIAAGLKGVDEGLTLPDPVQGSAYEGSGGHVPTNIRDALRLFRESEVAADAFGHDVVQHYARAAEHEIEEFDRAVTDWEKYRGFERL